jgi:hypothetical protein
MNYNPKNKMKFNLKLQNQAFLQNFYITLLLPSPPCGQTFISKIACDKEPYKQSPVRK